jgi:signal transduction histidine kinase
MPRDEDLKLLEELKFVDVVSHLQDPFFIVTQDGTLLGANQTGQSLLGITDIDETQEPVSFFSFVEAGAADPQATLKVWLSSRTPVPGRIVLRTSRGWQAIPLTAWCGRPAEGSTTGIIVIRCLTGAPIAARFASLNEQLEHLRSDIAERRRMEQKLTEAIKTRDDFMAVAAHELRNPLNIFKLTLQVLYRTVDQGEKDDKLRSILKRCDLQLDKLSALVDRLLDVSRLESGEFDLYREKLDLAAQVESLVSEMRDQYPNLRIELNRTSPVEGYWDRIRLDQAIANLLSNAVKYGMGKPIEVTVAASEDGAWLTVRDGGMGIPAESAQRIFDKFGRISPHAPAGLGLGLWITRHIIEAHGGTISVDSQTGQGAAFVVRLPLNQVN